MASLSIASCFRQGVRLAETVSLCYICMERRRIFRGDGRLSCEGLMDMETALVVVFFAFLGASLGSFLNVVALRSISGKSWSGTERSVCASCGSVLEWRDLIPLVSWCLLRGKCRRCGVRFGVRYFIVEFIGALVGGLLVWRWGVSITLLFALTAAYGLFLNALTDFEDGYVFDIFPLAMGIIGILLRLPGGWGGILDGLIGAALGFAIIACIILVSRGGMGWGDATLAAGAGAIMGWKMLLLTLYSGFMAGGILALLLLLAGKVRRKDAIPLVPFLALGGFFTLLAGPRVLLFFGSAPGWPW